jgi:hypothetical protein
MTNARTFGFAAIVSATTSVALLAIWYVFAWPTSDVRTRMYILLYMGSGPTVPFLVLWLILTSFGFIAAWACGWRGMASAVGAAAGGGFGVLLLWSRLLGLYVWLYDEQVTLQGQLTRTLVPIAIASAVFFLAKRVAGKRVAA